MPYALLFSIWRASGWNLYGMFVYGICMEYIYMEFMWNILFMYGIYLCGICIKYIYVWNISIWNLYAPCTTAALLFSIWRGALDGILWGREEVHLGCNGLWGCLEQLGNTVQKYGIQIIYLSNTCDKYSSEIQLRNTV